VRRSPLLAILATAAAATATGLTGAAGAHASGVNYVALGDSYSSGVGSTNSYLNSCDQSTNAYPYLYAQQTSPDSFSFEACTGATTGDVESSQLSALSSSTTLVSITIGGNDVGFSTVMEDCILEGDSGCVSAVDNAEATARNSLPGWLDTLYSKIRSDAPNAHVVVLGYPQFYDLSNSSSCIGLDTTKRDAIDGGDTLLNNVIQTQVAKYSGFTWVSATGYFSGHEICDSDSWLHALSWPVSDSYHPTAAGQQGGYLPAFKSGV
jgi:lysophospholipase L1-like esterase